MDELIERLRSVKWEVIDDDDWDSRCVFVDMRPDDFEALLTETASALEAAREDAERWRARETTLDRICADAEAVLDRALLKLEEREQRDEALLRQALEALGQIATDLPWELTGLQADTIAALRERLAKGMEQKA